MINLSLTENQKMTLNLLSSLIFFATTIGINFFLTPYIVNNIGIEANGFISLGNNFITYASLVTIALSSMSSRFITIKLEQGKEHEANVIYTSVTVGNIIASSIVFGLSLTLVYILDHVVEIPHELVFDVKLLFVLLFLNFSLSSAFSSWKIATFATNKLYLDSIRDMQGQILRLLTILILFIFFKPAVFYVGIAGLVATIFTVLFSYKYKSILLTELRVDFKYFSWKALGDLLASGIWNTIITAGQLLLSGLDLLIANVFIGPIGMGLLALSKTLPNIIIQLSGRITNVFTPNLTINYARNNKEEVIVGLKKGMKITAILLTIPLGALIVYGYDFYKLWVPGEDAFTLQILSVLAASGLIFTSGIQVIYKVFTVLNKLKVYAFLILISGVVTTIVVYVLLTFSNIGIYAIAGASTIINLIRNMFFTLPLASRYLKVRWTTFYPEVVSSIISVITIVIIGFTIKFLLPHKTWIDLIIAVSVMSLAGLFVNMRIVLSKKDRNYLYNMFLHKIRRRVKGENK